MMEMGYVVFSTRFGRLELVPNEGQKGYTLPARPRRRVGAMTDNPRKLGAEKVAASKKEKWTQWEDRIKGMTIKYN